MPQPVMSGYLLVQYSADAIANRPKLLSLIGSIVVNSGHLEEELITLFGTVMGSSWDQAEMVLSEVTNTRTRRELLLRATQVHQFDHLRDEIKLVIDEELKSVSGRRNIIVHSKWGVSDDYPEDFILVHDYRKRGGKIQHLRYSERDFKEVESAIIQLTRKVHDLNSRILEQLKLENWP